MSFRGGRPVDPVWSFFEKVELAGGKTAGARCLACKVLVSAKADRLKGHLAKCKTFEHYKIERSGRWKSYIWSYIGNCC